VLRPGSWELYREVKGQDSKVEFLLEGAGSISLSEIPVTVVYSRKLGYLVSRPPLLDLAMTNISH